jgi:hypothetical protein
MRPQLPQEFKTILPRHVHIAQHQAGHSGKGLRQTIGSVARAQDVIPLSLQGRHDGHAKWFFVINNQNFFHQKNKSGAKACYVFAFQSAESAVG